jgi:hypothetical protein
MQTIELGRILASSTGDLLTTITTPGLTAAPVVADRVDEALQNVGRCLGPNALAVLQAAATVILGGRTEAWPMLLLAVLTYSK